EIEDRAADDLEHIRGGGLLLQRLAQLVQQPSVLDGDNRLAREAGNQLDLLICEWADLLAVDGEGPDQFAFLQDRNVEDGSEPSEIDGGHEDGFALDVGRVHRDLGDMNRLPRLDDAAEGSSRARPLRAPLPELGKCFWYAEHRSCPPRAILESKQTSETGLADAHRVLQHRAEDRLQFAGRAANHTEDLGCRR